MKAEETYLKGCFVITPHVIEDDRGHFFESFNQNQFNKEIGLKVNFVQDNQSKSNRGVLRGLHFQTGIHQQAKLVRVIQGSVLDVCVDIRRGSETFGENFSIILNAIDNNQLYIPRGFAHGFLVLEDDTIFNYKCDNYYNKTSESGIIYNDETLKIEWSLKDKDIILSPKDQQLPTFKSFIK
jgi:dTDP-4-dehydrorhamnose 3,5-epimerase